MNNEQIKLEWEQVVNGMDEHERRRLLLYVPDCEAMERLKGYTAFSEGLAFAHVYETGSVDLVWQAVEQAFSALENIRKAGISTHGSAHAAAFLFKKTLDIFEGQHVNAPSQFRDIVMRDLQALREAFDPVFKVLTAGVSFEGKPTPSMFREELCKREKDVLVRAFWGAFAAKMGDFRACNWRELYKNLWNMTLEAYLRSAEICAERIFKEGEM